MKLNYKLGELIRNIYVKNKDLHCNNLKGLSMTKEFRASTSNIVGTDLSKYKIVAYKQFACDFMSAIRVHKMPIAFNSEMEEILVSPAYAVFEVIDENIILPEYLMMWFRRSEFDRYADFRSDAAIRGGYGWNELCETEIKLPSLEEQRKKVQAYKTITDRIELKKKINDNIKSDMWFLPGIFLIRQSIELGLKALLCRIYNKNKDIQNTFEECCHDVSKLFRKYIVICEENYLTNKEREWLINYLRSLEDVDSKSDMFRFPFEYEFLSKYQGKFLDNVGVTNNLLQAFALVKKCLKKGIPDDENKFNETLEPEFLFLHHMVLKIVG